MPTEKLLSRTLRPRSPEAKIWFLCHDIWQRPNGSKYKTINPVRIDDIPIRIGSPGLVLELAR